MCVCDVCVWCVSHRGHSAQLSAGAQQAALQRVSLLQQALCGAVVSAMFTQLLTGRQQGRLKSVLYIHTYTHKYLLHMQTYTTSGKGVDRGRAVPSLCAAAAAYPPAASQPCPAHTVCSAWSDTQTHTHAQPCSKHITCITDEWACLTSMSGSSVRWMKEPSLWSPGLT